MVIGVNPNSYIIYRMTGIKPVGRPNLPSYVFKSIEPPGSGPLVSEYLKGLVSYRPSLRGVLYFGSIFTSASQEMVDAYRSKLGLDVDMHVGTYQTVSIDMEERRGWYVEGEIERIDRNFDGTYSVYLVGKDKPIVTEYIWSTIPMRVLLKLLGLPTHGLERIFIYRYRSKKAFDKDVNSVFDPEFEVVYDADPNSKFSKHIRIGVPGSRSGVVWYSEVWSSYPIKDTEGLVKFYTVPMKPKKKRLPKGVEVIGAYAEWDYSINITSVIEKTLKLAKRYNVKVG